MHTIRYLLAAPSISKEILSQVLAVSVKAKVLIKEEIEQYGLNPSNTFLVHISPRFHCQTSNVRKFGST